MENKDADLTASGNRIEAACTALQTIATDNGVDVDLQCQQ
jgi:hypothetical protein